jgi:hypothetical protein
MILGSVPPPFCSNYFQKSFRPKSDRLLAGPVKLICGPGIDPYMNIVDDKDMPIPAFGPVEVPMEVATGK